MKPPTITTVCIFFKSTLESFIAALHAISVLSTIGFISDSNTSSVTFLFNLNFESGNSALISTSFTSVNFFLVSSAISLEFA